MQVKLFARNDYGLPSTQEIEDLSDRMIDLSYVWSALWGPLTASITLSGTVEDGYTLARQSLGNPIEIWSDDGEWCWEGLIWDVTFGAGQRTRSRSLEAYANRVRVHWQNATTLSEALPLLADDADGQRRYGVIEYQHNAGSIEAAAVAAIADQVLSERSQFLWLPNSGYRGADTPSIEVRCMGWYRTLGYQACTLPTWGDSDIALIMESLLVDHGTFLSDDVSQLPLTGVLSSATLDTYETGMEVIKRLVGELPSYTFGIGRGRVPYLRPSHRLNTTEDYVEQSDGTIETVTGSPVQPWLVRPDTILRQADFISGGPYTDEAIKAIENIFISETVFTYPANEVRYKPAVVGVRGSIAAL